MSSTRLSGVHRTLQAREFKLTDDRGRIGARLSWTERPPGVQLFDQDGRVRAALFLEANGVPDLYLYDQNASVRAALNLLDSGTPNLAFLDATNEHMVEALFDEHQAYSLKFFRLGKQSRKMVGIRRITADDTGLRDDSSTGAVR